MRRRAKPAKAKVEAKLSGARKPQKNEGSKVRVLETRLAEARAQQAATTEILRVIGASPTDVQPVFDAIVTSAVRLLGGYSGSLTRRAGDQIELVALTSTNDAGDAAVRARYPQPLQSEDFQAQALRDRAPLIITDAQTDPRLPEATHAYARARGWRSAVMVPMLRHDEAVGTISVTRREAGGFTDDETALLQTFAAQAVIAIENARLFKELDARNRDLTEALDQQTATSEILRVISSSPTDVQPVFDAIARNAVTLCGGATALVLRFDGEMLRLAGHHAMSSEGVDRNARAYPRPPGRDYPPDRAFLDRIVVHVPDLQAATEFAASTARQRGAGSQLAVPLLRGHEAIGVIGLARDLIGPFPDNQIVLLQTFADQAVIAIENVRLFTELREKNRALTQAHAQVTESLDQQTATAEILRVISRAPTDLQPVFDAIVDSAMRLLRAWSGNVCRFDGERIHLAATRGGPREAVPSIRDRFPTRPAAGLTLGRCILHRAVVEIEDVETEVGLVEATREMARARGWRSALAVPMLRDGEPVGAIMVTRTEPGGFGAGGVELLQTFADQAVIAIENVRLFTELQARTDQLTSSVQELRALGEVSQAVSSTLDLETVLATIVTRAVQLSGSYSGIVYEFDETTQHFHARATHQISPEHLATLWATPIRLGEGAVGRAAVIRQPVEVADIEQAQLVAPQTRGLLVREGMGSLVAVPLVREDQLFGGLVIVRRERGAFSPQTVATLQTFATQSTLAIQNARLFREIADKSRQLEAASQHKSEFLANMSHELRTPLNAIIGFSEVLSERMFGELNEKQEEYLRDIYASGTHLLSLINDILDLSKIEAGRMELELTDFDLPQAIDNALILVRERAGRRGITLEHSVDERLSEIRGDERKVKQVLLNLLSNALKFTPEGGRVEVRAGMVAGMAEISVTDTGVGIAPEDQGAIFEEFRQVGTADKKAEGTGLGLTLCRKFVELHGGKIWVKSQLGGGSTFTFTIPMRRGE